MANNQNKKNGSTPYVSPNCYINENKEIKYDEIGNIKAVIDRKQYDYNIKQSKLTAFKSFLIKACIWVGIFGIASALVGVLLRIISIFF